MFKKLFYFCFILVLGLAAGLAGAQSVNNNFQSKTQGSGEVPEEYLPDYGEVFADSGEGLPDGVVNYHAVICGIADYQGALADTPFCDKDAYDLQDVLLASFNWTGANITVLVDGAATKSAIRTAIENMGSRADADDVCLFFFSGEGAIGPEDYDPQDEADEYDEYLIPYDGFTDWVGAVYSKCIRDDELGNWMAGLPTDKYVVFLDACNSGEDAERNLVGLIKSDVRKVKGIGHIGSQRGDGLAADLRGRRRTKDLDDNGYGVVVTACEADGTCITDSDLQNSVFSYYLLQGMAGPADSNGNGWISAEECHQYVGPRAEYNYPEQNAQKYDGHLGELDFLQLSDDVQLLDDFETGNFDCVPWEHSGDRYWNVHQVNRGQSLSGIYSTRAGIISHFQSSALDLTWYFPHNGYISFWRKVSSEHLFDYLNFYIDGVLMGAWSGDGDLPNENWAEVGFPVFAGTRTLEWIYSKDPYALEGEDTAWIDDIQFRFSQELPLDPPVLHAEPETTPGLRNTISWDSVPGTNRYFAQCAYDANFVNLAADSGWMSETTYTFTGLEAEKIYWYQVKVRPVSTWSHTSQKDFETDTLIHTRVTTDGDVVLAGSSASNPEVYVIQNPSFESVTGWTAYETDAEEIWAGPWPAALFGWASDGDYASGTFFWSDYYHGGGDYGRIRQNVDWTGVGLLRFDYCTFFGSELRARVLIGGIEVWSAQSTGSFADQYFDVTIDVSGFTGSQRLELRVEATEAGFFYGEVYFDNLRTYGPSEYVSSGSILSRPVDLPIACDWDVVDFNTTMPPSTELSVDVLPANGSSPIPGYENIASGTNLSAISEGTIRLRANLSTSDPAVTPALHDWSVSYTDASRESNWSNVESSLQSGGPEVHTIDDFETGDFSKSPWDHS